MLISLKKTFSSSFIIWERLHKLGDWALISSLNMETFQVLFGKVLAMDFKFLVMIIYVFFYFCKGNPW